MPELEGKILGRYELTELIDRGGMAVVYKGIDLRSGIEYAIKALKRADELLVHRFEREAKIMLESSHPHLVPIYDYGSGLVGNNTWYYITMPILHGGTLRNYIHGLPLPLERVSAILNDIADALGYLHSKNIIHRDIKATNVLFDDAGWCYLSDFGIARINNSDLAQLTHTGIVLGTPDYIAPELLEANHKADVRSDLYSLGVLLFEMVTGRVPFLTEVVDGQLKIHRNELPPVPSTIVQQIPESVDAVILRALAREPEQRFGSASEMADAFRNALSLTTPTTKLLDPLQRMILSDIASAPSQPDEDTAIQVPTAPAHAPVPPFSAYKVPATKPPSHRNVFITALIALVACMLIIISVIIIGQAIASTTRSHNEATATAGSEAATTATVRARATASAIAAITATTQARATATASAIVAITATAHAAATATEAPFTTATSGTPTYSDTLTNPNASMTRAAQWDGADGTNSQCTFKPNGYHVLTTTSNLQACQEAAAQYRDATVKVDVTILAGDSGGLFLRFSGGAYNGYLFEIDSNGNYKFSIFGGNTIQDWTSSSALKTGYNVTNTITVIMNGDSFALYANGTYIATLTDPSYTYESGNLALFASAPDTDTEVVFSNLKVYPLVR